MTARARILKINQKPEVQYDKNKNPLVSLANLTTLLAESEEWIFETPLTGGVIGAMLRRHRLAFDVMKDCVVTLAAPLWPLEMEDKDTPTKPGPWSEADTLKLRYWFETRHHVVVGAQLCEAIVNLVARRQTYDPLRTQLKSVTWDGISRVGNWTVTYLGAADTPYHRAVGRCWLIAGIARVFRPGCKVDNAIVLEGGQGKGKSTAISILGGAHYTDQVSPLGTKDASADLRGAWLIELSELSAFTRSEIEIVKGYITRQTDRYRPAYGRMVKEYPRTCIFAGTTNSDSYLKDPTGDRRFWPVKVDVIDLVSLRRDRDQLWAEAKVLFDQGEQWHLTEEETKLAREEQQERAEMDPWQTFVDGYINDKARVEIPKILEAMGFDSVTHLGQKEQNRVVAILVRAGWKKARLRVNGYLVWFYIKPESKAPVPTLSPDLEQNLEQQKPLLSKPNTVSVLGVPGVLGLKQELEGGGVPPPLFCTKRGELPGTPGTPGTLGTPGNQPALDVVGESLIWSKAGHNEEDQPF